jgi:hypothetical protein
MSYVPILGRSAPGPGKTRDGGTQPAGVRGVWPGVLYAYFVDHFSATISASSYEYLIR